MTADAARSPGPVTTPPAPADTGTGDRPADGPSGRANRGALAPIAAVAALILTGAAIGTASWLGWNWAAYIESYTLTNIVIGLGLTGSGVMIAWHRPRNRVGLVFILGGLGHLVSAALCSIGNLALTQDWPEPVVRAMVTGFLVGWTFGLPGLFLLALLLFPDGHLPSRRWSWLGWAIVGGTVVSAVVSALNPEPGVVDDPRTVSLLAWPAFPVEVIGSVLTVLSPLLVVAVLASLVIRYRRGDERTRRQLLWLILAVLAILVLNAQRWLTGDGPVLLLLSVVLVPIAVAIAIVRYQLLDIRIVLSRTLLYGTLIALVVAVYAGIVAGLTLIVPPDASRTVAAIAAVTVALLFAPLRNLLQRAISRAFYGTRADPAATVARVQAGLRQAADLVEAVTELRDALRVPRLALVAEPGGDPLAAAGTEPETPTHESVPLDSGGERMATLLVTLRPGERRLHQADRRTLELVAPLLALVLREHTLVAEIRRARAHTVEAREREREMLHRDLHDGLGPTLTGAALRADAAGNLIDRDPERARAVLGQARADIGLALGEVRRVVYGLRPIPLDERGLAGAIVEHAAQGAGPPVRVTVDEPLPELTPAVELAAYRIALEGIANVRRHSSGSAAAVGLARDGDGLRVTVHDNGIPPSDFRPGVGIRSIRDRAEELGGRADVGPVEDGWLVSAWLPTRTASSPELARSDAATIVVR
ncbi:MAG TPA: histidine kinase [Nakamurella sp.]